jgi:hypothetical protein
MKIFGYIIAFILFPSPFVQSQVWQWSVDIDGVVSNETNAAPVAFLWIPEKCKQVRGVVVGQHNMLEEGILEHKEFRKALSDIDFAEIWVTPGLDLIFDFTKGAGDRFNDMLKKLAEVSGYSELVYTAIVPIGHSAAASYPWNFGAWNPQRTLAMLSIHGDAPLSHLTGSGRPNPDWGSRNIDGIPGLMVMGEYEWWEDRLQPAMKYRNQHPNAVISLLADAGRGHFDYSDQLVKYLALFIKKAAFYRLPKSILKNKAVSLKPIKPSFGWLADRWHRDSIFNAIPAPLSVYGGNRSEAFWYFDKEMANATEEYYALSRQKLPQYIGFIQADTLLNFNLKSHARINGTFKPQADGLTFNVKAVYTDALRTKFEENNSGEPINITRICGPVVKIDDTTFRVQFYKMGFNSPKRTGDIWLMATSEGNESYKSTVQQFNMRIPLKNEKGVTQKIDFPYLPNIERGSKRVLLKADSDRLLPVSFYVKEGPAEILGNELRFSKIPPRSKFPVKVTVVAWQYGISDGDKIQSAEPVSRTFYIE